MALPATDTFTGADGTSLPTYSANWSVNTGAFVINTNGVCTNSADAECGAGWNADTFDNDQYALGTLVDTASQYHLFGVAVRVHTDGTTDTYYGFYTNVTGGNQLFRQVAGTWSQLGSEGTVGANGQIIRLSVSGTTLTPTINGVTTNTPGAQTDNSIASGRAGLSGYSAGTANRLDNWEGGNLNAAATGNPYYAFAQQ